MQAVRRNSFCGSGCAPVSRWRSPTEEGPRRWCLKPPRLGVVLIWEFLHWYASVGPRCLLVWWLWRACYRMRSKARGRRRRKSLFFYFASPERKTGPALFCRQTKDEFLVNYLLVWLPEAKKMIGKATKLSSFCVMKPYTTLHENVLAFLIDNRGALSGIYTCKENEFRIITVVCCKVQDVTN